MRFFFSGANTQNRLGHLLKIPQNKNLIQYYQPKGSRFFFRSVVVITANIVFPVQNLKKRRKEIYEEHMPSNLSQKPVFLERVAVCGF